MHNYDHETAGENRMVAYVRGLIFRVISMGPIPNHIAFIMDGNRRYTKKLKLKEGGGHEAGFLALMKMLKYCHELGVKYITVYAFSIDNFKRSPEEVQSVMDLMEEVLQIFLKRESIIQKYGIRVIFIGDLKLLNEQIRVDAEKVMTATAGNTNATLLVCVAYTSTHEISHAVDESCKEKMREIVDESCKEKMGKIDAGEMKVGKIVDESCKEKMGKIDAGEMKVADIEKCMYMRVAPDPDVMFRTSGETRLSNFLLWQTTNCLLYSPKALWPELGLRHFLLGVLQFQASYSYLEKTKKQS